MPRAADEYRAHMKRMFGNETSHVGPVAYLKAAGYVLNPNHSWAPKPGITAMRQMTAAEHECLMFLVHVWDYGFPIFAPKAAA